MSMSIKFSFDYFQGHHLMRKVIMRLMEGNVFTETLIKDSRFETWAVLDPIHLCVKSRKNIEHLQMKYLTSRLHCYLK